MVKFGYAIAYVDDVEAALRFYEGAFGLTRRFLHESGDYGELDTGSTVLAFKPPQQKPWGQVVSYVRCPSGVLLELCTPIGG